MEASERHIKGLFFQKHFNNNFLKRNELSTSILYRLSTMKALFQELMALQENGTCRHHPDVVLLQENSPIVGRCPHCEQESSEDADVKDESWRRCREPDNNDTWTTCCGSEGSSGRLQAGMSDSAHTSNTDDSIKPPKFQRTPVSFSRWYQLHGKTLEQTALVATLPVLEQMNKLASQVQEQAAIIQDYHKTVLQIKQMMQWQHEVSQKQMEEILGTKKYPSSSSPAQVVDALARNDGKPEPSHKKLSLMRDSLNSLRSLQPPISPCRESQCKLHMSAPNIKKQPSDIRLDGSFDSKRENLPNLDAIFDSSETNDSKLSLQLTKKASSKSFKFTPPMEIILEGPNYVRAPSQRRASLPGLPNSEEVFRQDSLSVASSYRWGERSSNSGNESASLNNSRRSIHNRRSSLGVPSREILTRRLSKTHQVSSLTLDPALRSSRSICRDGLDEEEGNNLAFKKDGKVGHPRYVPYAILNKR